MRGRFRSGSATGSGTAPTGGGRERDPQASSDRNGPRGPADPAGDPRRCHRVPVLAEPEDRPAVLARPDLLAGADHERLARQPQRRGPGGDRSVRVPGPGKGNTSGQSRKEGPNPVKYTVTLIYRELISEERSEEHTSELQ